MGHGELTGAKPKEWSWKLSWHWNVLKIYNAGDVVQWYLLRSTLEYISSSILVNEWVKLKNKQHLTGLSEIFNQTTGYSPYQLHNENYESVIIVGNL